MQLINLSSVSFGKNAGKRLSSNNDSGFRDVMSREEYDSFSRQISEQVESVLAEAERKRILTEKLEARCNIKKKKVIQEAIDLIRSQGEEIPERLIAAWKNLK